MGNLQQELELKIESLDIALQEASKKEEVKKYIELNQILLALKFNKEDFSIEEYNKLLEEIGREMDDLKETNNVKLFLELLEMFRNSKEAIKALESVGNSRK